MVILVSISRDCQFKSWLFPPGVYMPLKMRFVIRLLMEGFRTESTSEISLFSTFITKVTVKVYFSFVTATTLVTKMSDFWKKLNFTFLLVSLFWAGIGRRYLNVQKHTIRNKLTDRRDFTLSALMGNKSFDVTNARVRQNHFQPSPLLLDAITKVLSVKWIRIIHYLQLFYFFYTIQATLPPRW